LLQVYLATLAVDKLALWLLNPKTKNIPKLYRRSCEIFLDFQASWMIHSSAVFFGLASQSKNLIRFGYDTAYCICWLVRAFG
jgi:hypothetical protein